MKTSTIATAPVKKKRRQSSERIPIIDILRGFALCGILLIHVPIFARPGAPPGTSFDGVWYNELILGGLIMLVESKFFSLFATLFGISFALQWRSAKVKERPFLPMFVRRNSFLALFGLLHIILLWEGDILLLYAVAGFLLLRFRNSNDKTLLRWAAGLLGMPLLFFALGLLALALVRQTDTAASILRGFELLFSADFVTARMELIRRYGSDDVVQTAVQRTIHYFSNFGLMLARLPTVLAMFLFGFFVGKNNILGEIEQHLVLLRRAAIWGVGLGLPINLLIALGFLNLRPFSAFTALAVNQVLGGPLLAVGYAACMVLLWRRFPKTRLLNMLAPYGRTALTVYLSQSAICAFLFYGYGLGLVMELTPITAISLAVVINMGLITLSSVWLRYFRLGPLEWLWRSLTYGKVQKLRRTSQEQ